MSLLVKICGLTDPDAVSAAVEAGADAVGFVFAESVREITPERAAVISADVPARVLRIAVMLHPSNDRWLDVCAKFRPDVLQTDADDFARLDVPPGVGRWPVLREGSIEHHRELPDTFIYEGRRSGHGEVVDWQQAAGRHEEAAGSRQVSDPGIRGGS